MVDSIKTISRYTALGCAVGASYGVYLVKKAYELRAPYIGDCRAQAYHETVRSIMKSHTELEGLARVGDYDYYYDLCLTAQYPIRAVAICAAAGAVLGFGVGIVQAIFCDV